MVGRARGALIATAVAVGSMSGVVVATSPSAMAAPAATTVSASFTASPIRFGATGTLRGSLVLHTSNRGIAGQTVALFGRAMGSTSWQDMARTTRTASNGAYQFVVPDRTSTRQYQVRFGGSASVQRVEIGGEDAAGPRSARRTGDGAGRSDCHRAHDADVARHDRSVPGWFARPGPGQGRWRLAHRLERAHLDDRPVQHSDDVVRPRPARLPDLHPSVRSPRCGCVCGPPDHGRAADDHHRLAPCGHRRAARTRRPCPAPSPTRR